MRVTLLGFTVPEIMIEQINLEDSSMATQTHRFAWGLVEALRYADVEVSLLSAAPVSDFPRNPRKMIKGGKFRERGVKGTLLPFINLLGIKQISRLLAAWFFGGRELKSSTFDWVLVHGVHTPFLWYSIYAKHRFGVRVCVFVTDPPGVVSSSDSGLRRRLKAIDIRLTKLALSRVDALVVLAEPLATDFGSRVPYLVMEGIFDASQWDFEPRFEAARSEIFTVTYAGGLSEEYGVGMLLRAINGSSNPALQLQLFGAGPLEAEIRDVSSKDSRILEPRLLHPGELASAYSDSDLLVQPRPVDQDFVRYSFPSKLLEYMASGTPVISTRLPSIPVEYGEFLTWTEPTEKGLLGTIEELYSKPEEERRKLGEKASTFVNETRTATEQGRRILEFLKNLSH